MSTKYSITFIFMGVFLMCQGLHLKVRGDNLRESVLSFHSVGPEDRTQVI